MRRVDVQKMIQVLAEKQRWIKFHYKAHGETLAGVDLTRVNALRLMETRLRGLKQKTISPQKMAQIQQSVVHKEMHLTTSPFKGVFESGDLPRLLGIKVRK